MEEPKSMVTVSILTVGGTAEEAVLITVPRDVPLGDVKKALADMFDRPEILSDGRFLKKMPNGATMPHFSRKELIYEGPALALAPEAAPLLTLEEFDGFDEKVEIQSPRSLRALELQGVSLDELYYAPPECFWEPGLDTMIVNLHHDFFEAWRQDTLDMCRLQRDMVMSEDPGAEAQLDQSTRDWMISVNSSKTEGASRTEQPHEKSAIPRFYNTASSPEERIRGTGGNWSGALEPHSYPLTMQFFEGLKYWMEMDKVFERPYPGESSKLKGHRSQTAQKAVSKGEARSGRMHVTGCEMLSSTGISIPERLDLEAPGIKVKDASREVAKMVGELRRIPREAKRPQAVSLASNTMSVAVVQRRENSKARRAAVRDVVSHAESMAALADGQREVTDAHIKEVNLWRGHREACSQESRGPWKNEAQERNFANAYRRSDHWHKRREVGCQGKSRRCPRFQVGKSDEAVHESEMEAEEQRYEATIKIAKRDVAVVKRVGRIRDLTRIKFARQWLERRIRWAKQETLISKKNDTWKAATLQKQDDAQDTKSNFIEFKKEYIALRRAMARMAADREFKRQQQRRKAIAVHLTSFAEQAEAAQKARAELEAEASLKNKDLAWKERSFKSSHSMSSSTLSPQASRTSPDRTIKRFPRFDFGRFGAESLTGSTSGSLSQQMQKSSSSPAVAA
eukprot:symbB.v1.2.014761.t1/scaffold1081.1/size139474/18